LFQSHWNRFDDDDDDDGDDNSRSDEEVNICWGLKSYFWE